MAKPKIRSFFSVSFDLIVTSQPLPFNLYVNSSSHASRERFVRVWEDGEFFTESDLDRLKKYQQLYISEHERGFYLKSLSKAKNGADVSKAEIIKDSAIHYLGKIFDEEKEFTTEVLADSIEGCKDSVESMVHLISDYNIDHVKNLIGNLSFHDFYTFDHSINVSMYNIAIFKALKPNASKLSLTNAGLGGLLHDLGKIKIPTHIINNPGKLSDEEFEIIKRHPAFGVQLLCCDVSRYEKDIDVETIARVINEHHENYNGTGYPNKLEGEDIHILARITAISDFFDAITTKRSYHEVLSTQEALNVMSRAKGKKLDPKLFDLFVRTSKKIIRQDEVKMELPTDFDSCQPHEILPFREVKHQVPNEDYGQIIWDGTQMQNAKNVDIMKDKDKKAS